MKISFCLLIIGYCLCILALSIENLHQPNKISRLAATIGFAIFTFGYIASLGGN